MPWPLALGGLASSVSSNVAVSKYTTSDITSYHYGDTISDTDYITGLLIRSLVSFKKSGKRKDFIYKGIHEVTIYRLLE
jgi:hypothetical protein